MLDLTYKISIYSKGAYDKQGQSNSLSAATYWQAYIKQITKKCLNKSSTLKYWLNNIFDANKNNIRKYIEFWFIFVLMHLDLLNTS